MYMIYYVCKMYYACTDKLGVVGLCKACLCCCIEAKVFQAWEAGGGRFGFGCRLCGKGSGLAWWERLWSGLQGYGYAYGQAWQVWLWFGFVGRLFRYGYGSASWVGFAGMVMVWISGYGSGSASWVGFAGMVMVWISTQDSIKLDIQYVNDNHRSI